MTTTLTGVSSGSVTPVTGPSAGEAVTAASVNTLGKGLVDNDASLNAIKLNLSGGTMTGTITSRDIDVQATYRLTIASTADFQMDGTATIDGNMTLGAASITTATAGAALAGSLTQTGSVTRSGSGGIDVERPQVVSPITAATTVSTSADTWWVDTPTVNMTWTLKSTSPTPPDGVTVNLIAYNTTLTEYVTVKREDGSTMITLGQAGNGTAVAKFLNGRWGLASASLVYTVGTAY